MQKTPVFLTVGMRSRRGYSTGLALCQRQVYVRPYTYLLQTTTLHEGGIGATPRQGKWDCPSSGTQPARMSYQITVSLASPPATPMPHWLCTSITDKGLQS